MKAELPQGYSVRDNGRTQVIAARRDLEAMTTLLTGEGRELDVVEGRGGRGGARRIELGGGKVVWVRQYLRGGFVRHFVRDRFLLRPARPLRELLVTHTARAAGCPVPLVHGVCVEESGPFYRGWIATAEMRGKLPFIDHYEAADEERRCRLLEACGRAIRSLHSAGVYHVDLTGHNVLAGDDDSIGIIDFDRGFLAEPGDRRHLEEGLARFWRSMSKLTKEKGTEPGPKERDWLDAGYGSGLGSRRR